LLLTGASFGLLVVDMQNGYCHPQGGLARAGADNTPQQRVVPRVKELVQLCRRAGLPVFWSKQVHFPDDQTRARHHIPSHMAKRKLELCFRGSPDTEIVDLLAPEVAPEDYVFVKHRSSCFFDTTLHTTLRMMGVDTLIIAGVATNYCVESTIRDAYARDFDVVVVKDCVASSFPDLHAATLKNVEIYYGQTVALAELDALIAQGLAPAPV